MFLVLRFCMNLKNSPYIFPPLTKLVPVVHFRWPDKRNMPIDATKDILVFSNKVQGHNWFFSWTFSLSSSSSLHVFSIFPQPRSASHTHPQPPPSICSDMFSLVTASDILFSLTLSGNHSNCKWQWRTRSELKLEFLWVKFWVKVNQAHAFYKKLLKCHWWHLCGIFRLSGQWK